MDTITHGIAGALIGKAAFRGEDLFRSGPINRARIITWSLMLGAIFPDADMFREWLSSNPLLILTWHRSITHSLVCMPFFALLLAALTGWFLRWRKWDAPSFAALAGIYAIGILSHIFLDLVTTFGTMIWSPLEWSRPAWDMIFIIDFTFTALLLCPQILAWVYRQSEGLKNRAIMTWSVLALASLAVAALLKNVGAPISAETAVTIIMLLAPPRVAKDCASATSPGIAQAWQPRFSISLPRATPIAPLSTASNNSLRSSSFKRSPLARCLFPRRSGIGMAWSTPPTASTKSVSISAHHRP
jgi:membrane-bound metal-dependent hydrolase YbcI (DUF457 family)